MIKKNLNLYKVRLNKGSSIKAGESLERFKTKEQRHKRAIQANTNNKSYKGRISRQIKSK